MATGMIDYFVQIAHVIRSKLHQPPTWAHVVAVSLDNARKKSAYAQEPLLLELRKQLQRRILDRISTTGQEQGLTEAEIARASHAMEDYLPNLPVHERALAYLSDFHEEAEDWTLQAWRALLAEFRLNSEHFSGEAKWNPIATPTEPETPAKTWAEELDSLVGLSEVKQEVYALRDFLRIRNLRRQRGFNTSGFSLHQVFVGSPGTGKTSVARIMARIYKEFGFLSKGHLVETDRSGLVGQYIGATEAKTEAVIRQSIGGVLFIDEAYSLASGGNEDFGPRAIDTLVKMMEDHRHDLVVIVAGYQPEMERFLESNAGLSSRFDRFLKFADYSADELKEILSRMAAREKYTLADDLLEGAAALLDERRATLGRRFGNAREARKLWEKMLMRQAGRLAQEFGTTEIPDEELLLLKSFDLAPNFIIR